MWRDDLPESTGGAVYIRQGHSAVIVLDTSLNRVERNAALAHELVHHERGGGSHDSDMPRGWRAVAAREEMWVDREVARRLVPLDTLAELCDRTADLGEGVDPWMVAEEFDVTEAVARQALEELMRHERGQR